MSEPKSSTGDLVEFTGLVQGSISKLRGQLVEVGLLREVESAPTGARGRPPRSVRLGRDWAVAAEADITSEAVRVRGTTPAGRLLFVRESPLDLGLPMEETVLRCHWLVQEALADSGCPTGRSRSCSRCRASCPGGVSPS